MSILSVLNLLGEKVNDITLNSKIWDIEPNDVVLYDQLVLAQASLRQGTSSSKTRSEVSGGGRKPWRQKGTGRARQGSIRSPQWRGGGVVFGPTPRTYGKKQNKKERVLALKSALAYKVSDKRLVVIDSLNLESPKTKAMLEVLKNLNLDKKVLFVTDHIEENAELASRNIRSIGIVENTGLNTLEVIGADWLVVTEAAVKNIEEVLS